MGWGGGGHGVLIGDRHGQGRIVCVLSHAGQLGLYGYTAYSGAKFALMGFAEALQMEVRVNPGVGWVAVVMWY